MLPPAVLATQDTMTLAGFLREGQTPDLYHLMKSAALWMTGRPARARAHADSIIALLAPALRRGADTASSFGLFTRRTTLAEAYAYAGRPDDAAPLLDSYVADVRRGGAARWCCGRLCARDGGVRGRPHRSVDGRRAAGSTLPGARRDEEGKSMTRLGIEPRTYGLKVRCSTD